MKWPTPQEYNEAIQNCGTNFKDPELQKFRPELDKYGMPKPCSGQFATVYRVSDGSRSFAVRCFLNHYPDQEARYAAISSYLKSKNLPFMVPFEFQKQGIRVNGNWYPILKMEWITGDKIDAFLHKNLANRAALDEMATRWLSMIKTLKDTGIAHGDLQHGNIIVSQGALKLIDYDGMFVPSLKGYSTHEVGHRNYQHPKRSNKDFSEELDNFSAWVIYASIIGISFDKNFWAYAKAGDERLLLWEGDYRNPASSDILDRMRRSGNAKLKWMAEQIATFSSMPVLKIPKLDASSFPNSTSPVAFPGAASRSTWMAQAVAAQAAKGCPSCGKRLVEKKVPGLGVPYWQCETAPLCTYVKNDGEDVEHVVVPGVQQNPPAGNGGGAGLVFLDPTATGSPFSGTLGANARANTNTASNIRTATNQGSNYYAASTASTSSVSPSKKVRQAKATPMCPYCGGATIVTKTAIPQRMCVQFPTCMYVENA